MVLAGAVPSEQDPVHAAAALVRGLAPRPRLRGRRGRPQRRAHRPTGLASGRGQARRHQPVRRRAPRRSSPRSTWRCTPTPCSQRDVDYIVRDGTVELIDEMRGRVAQRRRWPDGLQAAVEAKEGLDASAEGEVLGTITVQAYIGALPEPVRDDRDRGARRRPAARVLQARGRGDPAEHAVRPRGRAATGSTPPGPRRTRR